MSSVTNPVEIFDLLPNKNEKYNGLLRHPQIEVLEKWHRQKFDEDNTIIKMNTGSGKTVIGLLILRSYLNDSKGPAVYVVPDNYLIEQVVREANDLGIKVTKDPSDPDFETGESILVINIHKIINGKSTFGINEIKKDIGCMVVDDAHACMRIAKSQFAVTIPRDNSLYDEIFDIFRDSIKHQSENRLLEIEDGDRGVQQLIPFWNWQENVSVITKLLHSRREDKNENNKSLFFNWALIKDNLSLADCVISSEEIAINLDFLPVEVIPSFNECSRRVFMSATIEDDTVLVSHFNIESTSVQEAISPEKANDIGERLIVIPQDINAEITDENLKGYFKQLSLDNNVVVLVPSEYRSNFWDDVADVIVKSHEDLIRTTNSLRQRHLGLVVLINRYDGIDLPRSACQILVLDGLPDARSTFGKFEEVALSGSKQSLFDKIQRIEQGMGRGVRSKEDYCVVFLMGNSLVKALYAPGAKDAFTEATRKQMDLSKNINKQIINGEIEEIDATIKYCLKRDPDWIKLHNATILKVKYNSKLVFNNDTLDQKKAFDLAKARDYVKASKITQDLVNNAGGKPKGYLKYKLAKYTNFYNNVVAQEMVIASKTLNSALPYPISGITYSKLQFQNTNQVDRVIDFNMETYSNTNEYILGFNAVLEKLQFNNYSANNFEQAVKDLGNHLGFVSQRPENDFNKGPDNLWATGENSALIIECKNEAETTTISKRYCNQLNGSLIWFENQYKLISKKIPIMIHPYNCFEYAASPHPSIRIINKEKLEDLRHNLSIFITQVASCSYDKPTVSKLIKSFQLEHDSFVERYTVNFTTASGKSK